MMPFALGEAMRAKRDGCDCPAWVIRCAHLEPDCILFIGDATRLSPEHVAHVGGLGVMDRFVLAVGAFDHGCMMSGCPDKGWTDHETIRLPHTYYASEADALAAFYAAERELLGRDVPS